MAKRNFYYDTFADVSERTVENLRILQNQNDSARPRVSAAPVTAGLGELITLVVLVQSDDPAARELRRTHKVAYKSLNAFLVRQGLIKIKRGSRTTTTKGQPYPPLRRLRNALTHFHVAPQQDGSAELTKHFAFADGPKPKKGEEWKADWWATIYAYDVLTVDDRAPHRGLLAERQTGQDSLRSWWYSW